MNPTDQADVNLRITIGIDLSEPEAPSIQIVATDPRIAAGEMSADAGPWMAGVFVDEPAGEPVVIAGDTWEPIGVTDPPGAPDLRPIDDMVAEIVERLGPLGTTRRVLDHLHGGGDKDGDTMMAKADLADGIRRWLEAERDNPGPDAQPVDEKNDPGPITGETAGALCAVESIRRDEFDQCIVDFANGRTTDGVWTVEQVEAAGLPVPHRTLRVSIVLPEPDMRALADGVITPEAHAHLSDTAEAAVRRLTDRLVSSQTVTINAEGPV
jgi:hypothetical protein